MARRILGLDEAGRGSILGPLVVGGFVVESTRVRELRTLGVRDSKLLSPERRRSLYAALASL
ncbi:MAG: ribonuclease HII, partial [Thermoplasmata archaeon]